MIQKENTSILSYIIIYGVTYIIHCHRCRHTDTYILIDIKKVYTTTTNNKIHSITPYLLILSRDYAKILIRTKHQNT